MRELTAKDSNIIILSTRACVHLCIQIISCLYQTIYRSVLLYNNFVVHHSLPVDKWSDDWKPSIEAASEMGGWGWGQLNAFHSIGTVKLPFSKALNPQLPQLSSSVELYGWISEYGAHHNFRRFYILPQFYSSPTSTSLFTLQCSSRGIQTHTSLILPIQFTFPCCQLPLAFLPVCLLSYPLWPPCHRGQAYYPVMRAAAHRGERKAQWLTEIRPLIRRSDWELWRGLSFLAGRDRRDRDVSRVPNPSTIRHTSAISDQLAVPGTGRPLVVRCLSMSFIVPFPSLAQWARELLVVLHRHTHERESTREFDEYSYRILRLHSAGQREAERQIHICAHSIFSLHTQTHSHGWIHCCRDAQMHLVNSACINSDMDADIDRGCLSILDECTYKQQYIHPLQLYMYTFNMPLAYTSLTQWSYRKL